MCASSSLELLRQTIATGGAMLPQALPTARVPLPVPVPRAQEALCREIRPVPLQTWRVSVSSSSPESRSIRSNIIISRTRSSGALGSSSGSDSSRRRRWFGSLSSADSVRAAGVAHGVRRTVGPLAVRASTVMMKTQGDNRSDVVQQPFNPSSIPPLPEKRVVAGCGGAGVDYLASVVQFPNPDDKIRTTDFQIQGGGNVGNALTAASRLGLTARIFTKVADDSMGQQILSELQSEGIDTSHVVVGKGGVSPFTYIIVDQQTATRTCIHTPGAPALVSAELSDDAIDHLLEGAHIAYFDARLADCAIRVARKAGERGLPILLDAEKPREGLDELLSMADYVVCSEKLPQLWTQEPTLGTALLQMALRLPKLAFVIVTLGALGAVMLDMRAGRKGSHSHDAVASGVSGQTLDSVIHSLAAEARADHSEAPIVRQAPAMEFALGHGVMVEAAVVVSTAQKLQPSEVVDTTGAGDAFIGAVLYGLCANLPPSKMLPLAAVVAAAKCQKLGARPGLPFREAPQLVAYF